MTLLKKNTLAVRTRNGGGSVEAATMEESSDEYFEDKDYMRYYEMYGGPQSSEEYEDCIIQAKKIIAVE